jgi:hypothetical protein
MKRSLSSLSKVSRKLTVVVVPHSLSAVAETNRSLAKRVTNQFLFCLCFLHDGGLKLKVPAIGFPRNNRSGSTCFVLSRSTLSSASCRCQRMRNGSWRSAKHLTKIKVEMNAFFRNDDDTGGSREGEARQGPSFYFCCGRRY